MVGYGLDYGGWEQLGKWLCWTLEPVWQ